MISTPSVRFLQEMYGSSIGEVTGGSLVHALLMVTAAAVETVKKVFSISPLWNRALILVTFRRVFFSVGPKKLRLF